MGYVLVDLKAMKNTSPKTCNLWKIGTTLVKS